MQQVSALRQQLTVTGSVREFLECGPGLAQSDRQLLADDLQCFRCRLGHLRKFSQAVC